MGDVLEVDWIEGSGFDSNVFLVRGGIDLLIDSGTGFNFERTRKKIEDAGMEISEIDVLINTHCHFDHSGGDSRIMEISNCELMASEAASEALRGPDEVVTLASNFGGDLESLEVSRVLEEGDEIGLGGESLEVLSTPGHSKGSISLYNSEEEVLFSGDVVFRDGIGRTDLPSSNPEKMKESLERLAELDVEKLYPGHGPIAEENAGRFVEKSLKIFF